jgi:hypothetical protein
MAQITDFIKLLNKQPYGMLEDSYFTTFKENGEDDEKNGKELMSIVKEKIIKQKIKQQIGNLGNKEPTIENIAFDMITIQGRDIPTFLFNVEYESNKPYMFMLGLVGIRNNNNIIYKLGLKKGISLSRKNLENFDGIIITRK